MKNVFLLVFILLCKTGIGQTATGKIAVAILNEQNSPVESVTVELLGIKDSVAVKYAITDNNGVAEITNIKPGSYLLKASMVGFNSTYSDVIVISQEKTNITIPSLTIKPNNGKVLAGVVVSAQKPFIQRLSDRVVVNVENSIISAGATALDVIERSPGITLDGDVISLRGRSGVLIMIDGKPSAMNGADLINFLRGLPSGAIDRIEIITNPPARYEAAGTSGIIDIRMKKDQRLGLNGTLSYGYGQGVYPKTNAGTAFNYRNKKLNIFGNYNYSYRKDFNDLKQQRFFYKGNQSVGSDEKNNYSTFYGNGHTIRAGADFFPGKKTIVGFVATTNLNQSKSSGNHLSTNFNEAQQPYYYFRTASKSNSHPVNSLINLNLKQSFNKGRELTADVDYGLYNVNANSSVVTNIFRSSSLQEEILLGEPAGDLDLKAIKVDYTHPLKASGRLDMGLKSSYVSSDNNARFFNVLSGVKVVDQTKTNRFFYKEYSNTVYVSFNKEYKNFNLQLGLRSEQTKIETEQVVGHVLWDTSYLQLFPSAFFNYKITKDQTLGVSVSRRIGRPGYSQLNPFISLQDITAYSTGNPQLLPQFTWVYQTSYTIKNFNIVFDYSKTTDPQV
ncbi:MAG TPA: outer membrane beta-barrel protein, partial [Segetibacter sp.]